MGATSGIGLEVARILVSKGWTVGVTGRREDKLTEIKSELGEKCFTSVIDVTKEDAPSKLLTLIESMGGLDLYVNSSGAGWNNTSLDTDKEMICVKTNALGFTQMIDCMYHYFKDNGSASGESPQIAIISSIAGTRSLGVTPAYSSTKRFQSHYVASLSQLARSIGFKISFTDIRPGFVDTDFISGHKYPMQLSKQDAATLIVKAILSRKRSAVIDWKYSIVVAVWKLIPQFIWEKIKVVRINK